MSNSRFRSAFTLIELLVVIAIIAILAAILFPVFAQAKQAAKGASSLSNIKQTTLASLMYNGDYDDVFVTPGLIAAPNYGWKNTWLVLIQPYMKNVDIFKCPGDTYSQAPTEAWDVDATGKKNPRFTYIANGVGRRLMRRAKLDVELDRRHQCRPRLVLFAIFRERHRHRTSR